MIEQIAIATALHGFIYLGRSVTTIFISRYRWYLQLSPHVPKTGENEVPTINKKSLWEVVGIPSGHLTSERKERLQFSAFKNASLTVLFTKLSESNRRALSLTQRLNFAKKKLVAFNFISYIVMIHKS